MSHAERHFWIAMLVLLPAYLVAGFAAGWSAARQLPVEGAEESNRALLCALATSARASGPEWFEIAAACDDPAATFRDLLAEGVQ
jgi:hypothetical protein